MVDSRLKFKSDRFKKVRSGRSRWLQLFCGKCGAPLCTYQKDGSGMLKRLYLDRIVEQEVKQAKNLVCKKCKTLIGIRMIYKKENRAAYRLFAGAVEKKIITYGSIS